MAVVSSPLRSSVRCMIQPVIVRDEGIGGDTGGL
jgi:hypothetical protein